MTDRRLLGLAAITLLALVVLPAYEGARVDPPTWFERRQREGEDSLLLAGAARRLPDAWRDPSWRENLERTVRMAFLPDTGWTPPPAAALLAEQPERDLPGLGAIAVSLRISQPASQSARTDLDLDVWGAQDARVRLTALPQTLPHTVVSDRTAWTFVVREHRCWLFCASLTHATEVRLAQLRGGPETITLSRSEERSTSIPSHGLRFTLNAQLRSVRDLSGADGSPATPTIVRAGTRHDDVISTDALDVVDHLRVLGRGPLTYVVVFARSYPFPQVRALRRDTEASIGVRADAFPVMLAAVNADSDIDLRVRPDSAGESAYTVMAASGGVEAARELLRWFAGHGLEEITVDGERLDGRQQRALLNWMAASFRVPVRPSELLREAAAPRPMDAR